ncbi:MAG: orotate phosphoribosyltransferase [Oscillospiraceae bacterium]|nr:orotate phosphoribosyltransferase [Oscillospiraceae bacterium]
MNINTSSESGAAAAAKRTIAAEIYNTAHLTGTFTLRSGQVSSEYFDKYLFEAAPALLEKIASLMKHNIPPETEVLAGLEMGGIPIVTALSLQTGLSAAFVRKEAKKYGTCKMAEGAEVQSKRACIVEDVVTTGGAVFDAVHALRKLGATVDTVLCVIQRNDNATAIMKEQGLALIPVFTMSELQESVAQG